MKHFLKLALTVALTSSGIAAAGHSGFRNELFTEAFYADSAQKEMEGFIKVGNLPNISPYEKSIAAFNIIFSAPSEEKPNAAEVALRFYREAFNHPDATASDKQTILQNLSWHKDFQSLFKDITDFISLLRTQ